MTDLAHLRALYDAVIPPFSTLEDEAAADWAYAAHAAMPALLGELEALRAVAGVAWVAKAHVAELREAWERGVIDEHDGKGGERSNRNMGVDIALRSALDALQEPAQPDVQEPP